MPLKVEYPPLYPAGFHPMNVATLRQKCVDGFPLSNTRATIMNGLEQVVQELESFEVAGEIWIDGSFMTQKIDPEDVDVLLRVDSALYDGGSPELRKAIDDFDSAQLKHRYHCDSYVWREYPVGHSLHNESEWDRAYWIRQFGFSRGDDYKGIVTIEIRSQGPKTNA
jgi:hypothetical protein